MKISQELEKLHKPVLTDEVMEALQVKKLAHLKKAKYIDATLGLAGHTVVILKNGADVLGIETDRISLELAVLRIKEACPTPEASDDKKIRGAFTPVHANFKDIQKVAEEHGFGQVDGILFDLGVSSYQLDNAQRGFSFRDAEAKLDMRMSPEDQEVTAAHLLNALPEKNLKKLLEKVLKKGNAAYLAKKIVERRKFKTFEKTEDLINISADLSTGKYHLNRATLPFLALRIAVNSELENLADGLDGAAELLGPNGRLCIITFHSAEEELVKEKFDRFVAEDLGKWVSREPVKPSDAEIGNNPKSRSAKLWLYEKHAKKH